MLAQMENMKNQTEQMSGTLNNVSKTMKKTNVTVNKNKRPSNGRRPNDDLIEEVN